MVKDIASGPAASNPQSLVNVNGTLFFNADDGTHGQELWKSDGSKTVMVKDINSSGGSAPNDLTSSGGLVFFAASDPSHGVELWRSDGTRKGTRRLTDIMPGSDGSYPTDLTDLNGTLYFHPSTAYPPNQGLWKSDGTTAGTALVTYVLFQGTGGPIAIGSTLYFTAWDQAHGTEVWKSDGTAQATLMVDDINPGTGQSWATQFTDLNGTLFFSATDGVYGRELWKTNGSAIGTVLVKDINPGYENSMSLEPFASVGGTGGRLFFTADDGVHGFEPWESNGSPSGTVMDLDINPTAGSNPSDFTTVGGAVLFAAFDGTQYGLWKATP
jgi:ELWxxDGT repeat protein